MHESTLNAHLQNWMKCVEFLFSEASSIHINVKQTRDQHYSLIKMKKNRSHRFLWFTLSMYLLTLHYLPMNLPKLLDCDMKTMSQTKNKHGIYMKFCVFICWLFVFFSVVFIFNMCVFRKCQWWCKLNINLIWLLLSHCVKYSIHLKTESFLSIRNRNLNKFDEWFVI